MKHQTFFPIWAAFLFVLLAGAPAAAQGSSVTLAWDPVLEANGYTLLYGTTSRAYTNSVNVGTKTALTVGGLAEGATYYFTVRAFNGTGQASADSNEVSQLVAITIPPPVEDPPVEEPPVAEPPVEEPPVEEPPVEEPPVDGADTTPDAFNFPRVRDVELNTLVNSATITVSGINAPTPITTSAGAFSVNGGPFTAGPGTIRNGQTVTVQRQSADTYHKSNRTRITIGGVSSDFVVVTGDAPLVNAPAAPAGLIHWIRDHRAIELAWEIEGSTATGYRVEVGSAPGLADVSSFTTGISTRFALSELPAATYFLRVRGVNDGGASEPSNEVSVTVEGASPGVPGMPEEFHYQVQGSSVLFTWSRPTNGGAPVRYVIEATDADGNAVATIDTGNTATSMIHDAGGSGVYLARVRAANSSGLGPASLPITVVISQ